MVTFQLQASNASAIVCRANVVGLRDDSRIGEFVDDKSSLIWSGKMAMTRMMHAGMRRRSQ